MIIVASGPSAKGFVPPDDIPVIAVNGVIDWISRADYWFSIDASPANVKRTVSRRDGVWYFMAAPESYKTPMHVTRLKRLPTESGKGISTDPFTIRTGNSAFGALNLAYHLGAERVMLVGVDGTNQNRCEGGNSGCLVHLPALFDSAAGQMKMVNCGQLGAKKIKRRSIEEGIEWLRKYEYS